MTSGERADDILYQLATCGMLTQLGRGREVMEIPTFCPPQRISDKRLQTRGFVSLNENNLFSICIGLRIHMLFRKAHL